jgi:hypothetical protein
MSDGSAPNPNLRYIAYTGLVRLLHWEQTSNMGTRIKLGLIGREELEHFDRVTKRSKKHAGQRYYAVWCNTEGEAIEGMPDELWFYGAAWSHNQGASVQFSLHDEDFDKIKPHPTFDGAAQGKAWVLSLIELDGEDRPIDQAQREFAEAAAVATPTGGPVSKSAGILCQAPDFKRFLQVKAQRPIVTDEDAATAVRQLTGVESRAWLDHDPDARAKYDALKSEFIRWGRKYA